MDEMDAIEEVNSVIGRLGYCWFAKYGRPIGTQGRRPEETTLCLIQTRKKKRRVAFYQIKGMTRLNPKPDECPAYYWNVPSRRRTWIKVERASSVAKRDLSELIVQSSGYSLAEAMNGSMSSHFWCFTRARK